MIQIVLFTANSLDFTFGNACILHKRKQLGLLHDFLLFSLFFLFPEFYKLTSQIYVTILKIFFYSQWGNQSSSVKYLLHPHRLTSMRTWSASEVAT